MEQSKILFTEHDRIRTYENGSFGEPVSADLKKLTCGAVIPLALLNTHTLKLSDRLSEDELRLQVEIRMFEEGNLNSDDEYTIDFIRHSVTTDDSALIEVFALSHTKASEYYKETLAKIGAIDRIVPGFMVYGVLYDEAPVSNDLFIYWGDEEAYAVIYQNGVYIAHRSIETLASIAVDIGLDLPKLKHFLSAKGVVEDNYLPEELNKYILLQEKIAKNVERIVHMINHKRGLFGLNGIDHLYLDIEGKAIPGIEAVFHAYGVNDLKISAILRDSLQPSDIHDAISAHFFLSASSTSFNLSPFTRKAPWYARESGKFLGIIAASLGGIVIASLITGWMISSQQSENEQLKARYEALRQETASLASTLKSNNAALKNRQEKSKALENEIALYHGAEDTADLVRQMHTARHKFLLDATGELGRYGLGAMLMEQNGSKEMSILVVSEYKKRDDIAKLMSGMFERGYQDVETREIKLDNGMYNSLVKVTR